MSSIIDQTAIDELLSLEEDNPGFFRDIIRQFLDEDAPTRMIAIHAALQQEDLRQVGREAHGLKNSCSVVGAWMMRDLCYTIEKSVQNASTGEIADLIGQLEQSFVTARAELEKMIASR